MPVPLRVGLAGLGTVGSGVLSLLRDNADLISARAGRSIEVRAIASRTPKPELSGNLPFDTDPGSLLRREDVDVVVESMGGIDAALTLTERAIAAGCSVVTANKALIAEHGNSLFASAERAGVQIRYEAAVAGSIPIIKALREGLAGNRIAWVAGIINGTTNYILTSMRDEGREFADVLAEAQALGYAEADPTFDIEGIDAAHKLTILSALAFGTPLGFDGVFTEGISAITREDFDYAAALGYSIKHLGITRRHDDGVELRVHPVLIPRNSLLSHVDGVTNAVLVSADASAATLYTGPGAGGAATASAMVADLVDLARGSTVHALGCPVGLLQATGVLPVEAAQCPHYLRIPVVDQPGVLSNVSQTLAREGVSIESVIQKQDAIRHSSDADWVPVVLVTDSVPGAVITRAINALQALPVVTAEIMHIRVEHLDA